jgi:HAD superfamily hydrolase (TIGR01484 family)
MSPRRNGSGILVGDDGVASADFGLGPRQPRPLAELTQPVRYLLSDVDGTMTQDGRLEAATLHAIEQLTAAGIPVIPVTGRSAGFGYTLLSVLPSPAVITENGAVTFVRDGHRIRKLHGLPSDDIAGWRRRMATAMAEVQAELPQLQLSSDSAFREVDLALDWNEEVKRPAAEADRAVAILREHGLAASRSNVHVNFCPPLFDKRVACLRLVHEVLGGDVESLASYAYVGDSLNDAPMFDGFPTSIGVANIRDVWDRLPHRPAYVTRGREAVGFREVIERLLQLR